MPDSTGMKFPLMLTLLALTTFAGAASPAGKAIYTTNCAGCHGANGQGGVGPGLKDAAGWTPAIFARAIQNSVDDNNKPFKAPMPHWGKSGFAGDHGKAPTPAEIKSLQGYLKTLKFK